MRILITNDDGWGAEGLEVLRQIAEKLSSDVWTFAPEVNQSGASHSMTLHEPLRCKQIADRTFIIRGTPTDCVIMGVRHFMLDNPPDLILSGVNHGSNLAEDVTYSGTIAAAMEGTLLGVPSIALSQHLTRGERTRWSTAEAHAADLIRKLVKVRWPKGVLLNVNFPDVAAELVTGVKIARQGRREIGGELDRRLDPRGFPYYWITTLRREEDVARPGTDLAAIARGAIAVTPLSLDLTHQGTMKSLREALL
jgi:5'-nucleotidase